MHPQIFTSDACFLVPARLFTEKGPKLSTPTLVKGDEGVTLLLEEYREPEC